MNQNTSKQSPPAGDPRQQEPYRNQPNRDPRQGQRQTGSQGQQERQGAHRDQPDRPPHQPFDDRPDQADSGPDRDHPLTQQEPRRS